MANPLIFAAQLQAARILAGLSQREVAERSGVSVPTIKRMEGSEGVVRGSYETVSAVVGVLEAAGVEFIPQNGHGPGVRLRDRKESK